MTMYPMILILIWVSVSCSNPVKMSMSVLAAALAMFWIMTMTTGTSWFPMMFTLLFTGGVLIMFMILSSFYPNEKNSKNNKKFTNQLFMILGLALLNPAAWVTSLPEWESETQMKLFFQDWSTGTLTTLMILMYFMVFLKILSKEKNCMRMTDIPLKT